MAVLIGELDNSFGWFGEVRRRCCSIRCDVFERR